METTEHQRGLYAAIILSGLCARERNDHDTLAAEAVRFADALIAALDTPVATPPAPTPS